MSNNLDQKNRETVYFDILEFLKLYENLPCLWNRSLDSFKDRKKRTEAERILSEKLGIHDMHALRRKIRNVRGTYNTEVRKIKASLVNGGEVHVPKLGWFPYAHKFLKVTTDVDIPSAVVSEEFEDDYEIGLSHKKILQRLRQKNIMDCSLQKEGQKDPEDCSDIEDEDMKIEALDDDFLESLEEEATSMHYADDYTLKNVRNEDSSTEERIYLETDNSQSQHSLSNSPVKRKKHKDKSKVEVKEGTQNEFDIFGQSVSVQLQTLPLEVALQVQIDIQAHITKTRLKYLRKRRKESSDNDSEPR